MNKKSFARQKPCFFAILFFSFITAFGCSQVTPEVLSPEFSVIFEYENESSNPNARMSIFSESLSDVRRYERIQIICKNGGYIWNFTDISKASNASDSRQWAGHTNLVMPQNEIFPDGKYELTFFNADEKDVKISVDVNYDSSFYDLKSEESKILMEKKNASMRIAIYDEKKSMIYFGEKTENLGSVRGIWNKFSNAKYFQDIMIAPGKNVICIMPVQEVSLE